MLAPITPPPTMAIAARFTSAANRLVPELPLARENHGDLVLVRRRNHVGVAHGTARLDNGGDSRFCGLIDTIAKREESVRAHHRTVCVVAGEGRLVDGKKRGVDARHLSGADTYCCAVASEQDRIRLHAADRAPCEHQILSLFVRRLAL